MHFFTSLPDSLVYELLSNWLSLKDICRADSAFCSKVERTNILGILRSEQFIIIPCHDYSHSKLLTWLHCREIRTSHLQFGYTTERPANIAEYVQFAGKNVKSLCLKWENQVQLKDIYEIAINCHNLQLIDIDTVGFDLLLVSIGLFNLLSANPNVEFLSLYNVNLPYFDGIQFNKLKQLRIKCTVLCAHNLAHLTQSVAHQLVRLCLYHVNLDGTDRAAVQILLKGLQGIRSLDLSYNDWVDDEILSTVAASSQQIVHLDVSLCKMISDAGIQSIVTQLTQLSTINIMSFSKYCKLTNRTLKNLEQHSASRLKMIHLTIHQFSQRALISLFEKCTNILEVGLTGRYFAYEADLTELMQSLPSVTTLNIDDILSNDTTLTVIAKHCHQLMTLYFTKNGMINQYEMDNLLAVMDSCPLLRLLGLDEESYDLLLKMPSIEKFPALKIIESYQFEYDSLVLPL